MGQLKNKNVKIKLYKNQNTDRNFIVDKDFDTRKLFWIINHIYEFLCQKEDLKLIF